MNIGAPEKFEYRGAPKSLNVGAPEKFEYRGAPKNLNIGRPKNVSAQELSKNNRFFYSCFVLGGLSAEENPAENPAEGNSAAGGAPVQ